MSYSEHEYKYDSDQCKYKCHLVNTTISIILWSIFFLSLSVSLSLSLSDLPLFFSLSLTHSLPLSLSLSFTLAYSKQENSIVESPLSLSFFHSSSVCLSLSFFIYYSCHLFHSLFFLSYLSFSISIS